MNRDARVTPNNVRAAPRPQPRPQQRPAVKKVAQKPKKQGTSGFDFNLVLNDISSSVIKTMNRPVVLVAVIAVFALVVTHQETFSSGFVGKWVEKNENNTLAKWITQNEKKFLGLAMFIPTLLDSPKNLQVILALATTFWVMLVPESSTYQYAIQSFALHTYFRVSLPNTRIVIVSAIAALYYLGWVSFLGTAKTVSGTNDSSDNATSG